MTSDPLQRLKSILTRHFQVQKQQVRERKLPPVVELVGSGEIIDHFNAIPDSGHRNSVVMFGKCPLQEEKIIVLVFGDQNESRSGHTNSVMLKLLSRRRRPDYIS